MAAQRPAGDCATLRAVQEDEPRIASVLRDLPPNARLMIVDADRLPVREIKPDEPIGSIKLEPGQGLAVVTVTVGPTLRPVRWQLMVKILVVHVLALMALVYMAVLLLPWPWWVTVVEAAVVLGALIGRHVWRVWHCRQSKANERRETTQ